MKVTILLSSSISINRNIVECKDGQAQHRSTAQAGINRNIVECKGRGQVGQWKTVHGINRNIVECKEPSIRSSIFRSGSVLIETLWNVKITGSSIPLISGLRINRNIVECKVI